MSGAVKELGSFVPPAKERGAFGTCVKDEGTHLPCQRWPRVAGGMADWRTPAKVLRGCRRAAWERMCDSTACSSQNLGTLGRVCQTLLWPTWVSTQLPPDKPRCDMTCTYDTVLINIKFPCYLLPSCIITGAIFKFPSYCINEEIFPRLLSPSQGHFS